MSRRSILGLGICAALGWFAYDWIQKNVEVVTVHASGAYSDYHTDLFIADDPDDPRVTWVRAERPDRRWLKSMRSNPEVMVRRNGRDLAYHVEVWNGEGDRARIDRIFRAKYGRVDQLAEWFFQRDSVPVRLEPSERYADSF